jgi:hypothetical protein
MGGFGGGGGANGLSGSPGLGGFGGGDGGGNLGGGGAGFGAAIFIRSGHIDVVDSQFANSTSTRGASSSSSQAWAKGAAIFAIDILGNGNGNDQGMPAVLPTVTGCANTFTASTAADAGGSNTDNADVFGADRIGLRLACDDRIFAAGFDRL